MEEKELFNRLNKMANRLEKIVFSLSIAIVAGTFGYIGLKTVETFLN